MTLSMNLWTLAWRLNVVSQLKVVDVFIFCNYSLYSLPLSEAFGFSCAYKANNIEIKIKMQMGINLKERKAPLANDNQEYVFMHFN